MNNLKTKLAELRDVCERARQHVFKLCKSGAKDFVMTIPPRDTDSDMLLCAALDDNDKLREALELAVEGLMVYADKGMYEDTFIVGEGFRKLILDINTIRAAQDLKQIAHKLGVEGSEE